MKIQSISAFLDIAKFGEKMLMPAELNGYVT